MGQFNALARSGEDHGMVANNIATAQGVNPDFTRGPLAGNPFAPVAQGLFLHQAARLAQDLHEGRGGPAGGVDLVPMVHFDNLKIEPRAEDFSGLPSQPEESVNPGGIISRPDDRDAGLELKDSRFLLRAVTGRPNDERLAVFRAKGGDGLGGFMKAEIDHRRAQIDNRRQIIPNVNPTNDLNLGNPRRADNQILSHPAFGAGNDDFGHNGIRLEVAEIIL